MLCRKGEDVLVKSTVVVAKMKVYFCLTMCVSLKIAYSVYMDRVIPFDKCAQPPALPPMGGTRGHHFDGTNFKPHKLLENAHAAKQQSQHYSPCALCRGLGSRRRHRACRVSRVAGLCWAHFVQHFILY
jgi:hypothetical protein